MVRFPNGSVVKNLPANAGATRDTGLIPGSGRCPGEGNGNPLQYYCQENLMDKAAWWATVHGITKSRTRLNSWTCTHKRDSKVRWIAGPQGEWDQRTSCPVLRRPWLLSLLWGWLSQRVAFSPSRIYTHTRTRAHLCVYTMDTHFENNLQISKYMYLLYLDGKWHC